MSSHPPITGSPWHLCTFISGALFQSDVHVRHGPLRIGIRTRLKSASSVHGLYIGRFPAREDADASRLPRRGYSSVRLTPVHSGNGRSWSILEPKRCPRKPSTYIAATPLSQLLYPKLSLLLHIYPRSRHLITLTRCCPAQLFFFLLATGTQAVPMSPHSQPLYSQDRQDESQDTFRIAAIGDSYSPGIGAGSRLGLMFSETDSPLDDWKCEARSEP
jgi:hypothetical protein